MKRRLCASNYSIEVTVKQFQRLVAKDTRLENRDLWDDTLFHKLEALPGVVGVEYNGHFGPFVYLTIEAEHDTPQTWHEVYNLVSQWSGSKYTPGRLNP